MIPAPFTMLLPALALGVWPGIAAVPSVGTYVALRQMARGGKDATVSVGKFHTTIPPGSWIALFAVLPVAGVRQWRVRHAPGVGSSENHLR
jgi:hypothetical protein